MISLQSSTQLLQKVITVNSLTISEIAKQTLLEFIQFVKTKMPSDEFVFHQNQWIIIGKKFNTNDKISLVKENNYQKLLLSFIKEDAMYIFKPSYFNRARIDDQYIYWVQKLGPFFFIQVIMIASKLKRIHENFYDKMRKSVLQNHIQIKILRILQLCSQKKRSVNSNKGKFLCIVQEEQDRIELTKQLGKMLRQSWKLDKKQVAQQKILINEMSQQNNQQNYFDQEYNLSLQRGIALQRGISINQSEQLSNFLDSNFI